MRPRVTVPTKLYPLEVSATGCSTEASVMVGEEFFRVIGLRKNAIVEVYNHSTGSRFPARLVAGFEGAVLVNGVPHDALSVGNILEISAEVTLPPPTVESVVSITCLCKRNLIWEIRKRYVRNVLPEPALALAYSQPTDGTGSHEFMD